MTAHEFANFLLSKPDLPIFCNVVCDFDQDQRRLGLGHPVVTPAMSEISEDGEYECLVIYATAKQ